MPNEDWEDINAPRGTFIGWGRVGQVVTGRVATFGLEDGTDNNGKICPQIVIELTEDAENYREQGTVRQDIPAGEFATITCSQANLKSKAMTSGLLPGNLVKVTFTGTYKTDKGTGKEFSMQVARTKAPAGVSTADLV